MQLTLSKCECPYMQHPYVRTFQSSLVLVMLLLLKRVAIIDYSRWVHNRLVYLRVCTR